MLASQCGLVVLLVLSRLSAVVHTYITMFLRVVGKIESCSFVSLYRYFVRPITGQISSTVAMKAL